MKPSMADYETLEVATVEYGDTGFSFEESPAADLLYQTSVYLAGGLPVDPRAYFAPWASIIEEANGQFRGALKQMFEQVGIDPEALSTFDDFCDALTA